MSARVTYIVSDIDKAIAFEWIALALDKQKINLSFIVINSGDSSLYRFLVKHGINCCLLKYSGRKDLARTFWSIVRFLRKQKSEVVHCHLFNASLLGLTASRLLGIKKRIYTRHHSTYHHEYFPGMVRWDRYCNYLATDIVSISNIVTQTLVKSEHVPEAKITRIPHGFDLESFSAGNLETKELLEKKYNPGKKHPVVGVISRFIEWKGIQYIIPAFQDVLKKHPNALLLLFNASGNYKSTIQSLLKVLPKDSFLEVEFEPEVTSLYSLFDVFVHTPIDDHSEAFGQVYVEALAAGIPSVFTLSGIAHEFVIDNKNALVVPHKDSPAILNSLIRLLENPTFASALAKQGSQDVRQLFGLDKMINALENLYTSE